MPMPSYIHTLAIASSLLILSGCGLKGELYMPQEYYDELKAEQLRIAAEQAAIARPVAANVRSVIAKAGGTYTYEAPAAGTESGSTASELLGTEVKAAGTAAAAGNETGSMSSEAQGTEAKADSTASEAQGTEVKAEGAAASAGTGTEAGSTAPESQGSEVKAEGEAAGSAAGTEAGSKASKQRAKAVPVWTVFDEAGASAGAVSSALKPFGIKAGAVSAVPETKKPKTKAAGSQEGAE